MCHVFMTFSIGVFFTRCPSSMIFVKISAVKDIHYWKRYITCGYKYNCACIFYIFLSIWIKFRRGSGHINSLNECEFYEKWCSESRRLLKVIRNYTSVLCTSIFYLGEICYKVSEYNAAEQLWVFENWCRESHMFLISINEPTFTCIPTSFFVPPLQPPSAPHSSLGLGLAAFCKYCYILFIWVKFI